MTDLVSVEPNLAVDDFLEQYGIRGMKWGVQGAAASSNPTKPVLGAKLAVKPTTRKEASAISKRQDFAARRRTLSDKDLKAMIERLGNEKKLKQLVEEDITPGKAAAKETLKWAGRIGVGIASVAVAGGVKYVIRTAATGGDYKLADAAVEMIPFPKKK